MRAVHGMDQILTHSSCFTQSGQEPGLAWNAQLATTAQSVVAEMRSFATGIRQDYAAVAAALAYEWSNGQVEGQINKLKLLKRQMYGRAKLDLLKARRLVEAA